MTEPTSEPTHEVRIAMKFGDTVTHIVLRTGSSDECADVAHRLIKAGLIDNAHVRPHNSSYTTSDGNEVLATLMEYALAYLGSLNKSTEQE